MNFNSESLFTPSQNRTQLENCGFRFGAVGTHTSRTLMFSDLSATLQDQSASTRDDFRRLVVEENCLGKSTAATRKSSFQRLSELFGLNPDVLLFRLLRRLWALEAASRPLLALLIAIARDPLLRSSATPIVSLKAGEEFTRSEVTTALRTVTEARLNDSILDKVVRNCASSWAQAGYLEGRTFKRRVRVRPSFDSVAMALALAHLAGYRGASLFSNGWIELLDCDPSQARDHALEAKRRGLLDMRISGDVVALQLDRLDAAFSQL